MTSPKAHCRPVPCHHCHMLVSRDLVRGICATHPAVAEPWKCPASPSGRHAILLGDDCTCGRNPHGMRLSHADDCALAETFGQEG